ncbi:DUF1598 domain-containing protein [Bremerella sp. T1]|uniref:DUF1598 domain-containing protein n=1 Tax=Bremerella sp. TYQ1 TaxID=3119568 RepID=UPI001CCE845C|nr:DUF1598 domain-containing protein [Bremerella volcania]UBM34763.1 DUF1598 domain-containing protein [Bremerella volcania]
MDLRLMKLLSLLSVALLLLCNSVALAQTGDDDDDDDDTTIGAGIVVDAQGVLKMRRAVDPTGRLMKQRVQQAASMLPPELNRPSKLRKISLNRLEKAVADALAKGGGIPHELENLAGLNEIKYVFYYPETKDIVLAGTAEGYVKDLNGVSVGTYTGKATLQLDDLVVALRAFGPYSKGPSNVGVSIDPTQEGLAKLNQVIASIPQTSVRPGDTRAIVTAMKNALGNQIVSVRGISPKTHFARVMVEADYRMKLIGIGLEQPPVNIPSYVEKARPGSIASNAMQRWYFVPNYDCVKVSDDGLAMELQGEGVKLIGASEMVTMQGGRQQTNASDRASFMFTNTFTKKYGELAEREAVYGQLRDLIDMLIASAYIQEQDYYNESGFDLGVLGDEDAYPVETLAAPETVETAVNAIWKGNRLLTPIGGGVVIDAKQALTPDNVQKDNEGELVEAQQEIKLDNLAAGQWWWD